MKKIKISGLLIVIISFALIWFINYIDNKKTLSNELITLSVKQKLLTQDISKNVFYIYKSHSLRPKQLNNIIKKAKENKKKILLNEYSKDIKDQLNKILALEKEFYKKVEIFKLQNEVIIMYANILLQNSVKDIYNINIQLITNFDILISLQKSYCINNFKKYEIIKNIMIFILFVLFFYLFTQVKTIIAFIQTFNDRSTKIIKNSTIKYLKKIDLKNNNNELQNAITNYNLIVDKIDNSILYSIKQIEYTSKSLYQIEENIEEFMDCCLQMEISNNSDINIVNKEDSVIEALDELINLSKKLNNLQSKLENLIKNKK